MQTGSEYNALHTPLGAIHIVIFLPAHFLCFRQGTIVFVGKAACQYVSLRFTETALHLIAFAAAVGGQHAVIRLARDRIMITTNRRRDGSAPPTADSSKSSPPRHFDALCTHYSCW